MVSSTLNPETIVRNSPATLSGFGNFMTGGSLSKSSYLSNAANKIVNFNRAGVTPLTPNISSLISNISTNILNQVGNSIKNTTNFIQNNTDLELNKLRNDLYSRITDIQANLNDLQRDYQSSTREIQENIIQQETSKVDSRSPLSGIQTIVQNIQVQAQNVLDNTLRSFSKDYQDKVKGFDDNRPSNVLSKFLDLYRNAIGFVNFFGDRKNINTVEQNLKSLRLMFEESFEVAKILRQTIIKIVNQLSNLPTASPTSGGLNLDIAVPNGRLKQAGGPMVRNIGRIARMGGIAGAGLLGLGGLAAATTGMGRAKQYQEELLSGGVSTVSGEQYMSGNMVESFSAIVDRFVAAVNGLISGTKGSSNVGGGGSIGSQSSFTPPPTSGGDYGSAGAEAVKNFAATQGYSQEFTAGLLSTIEKESGFNPYAIGDSGNSYGLFQFNDAAGRRQPFLNFLEQGGIKNPQELFLNPNSERALAEKNKVFNLTLEYMMQREQGKQIVRDLSSSKDLRAIMGGFEDIERYSGSQPNLPRVQRNNPKYNERLQRAEGYLKSGVSGKILPAQQSQVSPAPIASQETQRIAQTISQPAQKAPQTITLPPNIIDAGVPHQQSSGGGVVPQAPSGSGSYEVPFLPTTNPDNFLTMYSRIVYNIVDG